MVVEIQSVLGQQTGSEQTSALGSLFTLLSLIAFRWKQMLDSWLQTRNL